jgi:hypothetical protein
LWKRPRLKLGCGDKERKKIFARPHDRRLELEIKHKIRKYAKLLKFFIVPNKETIFNF